MNNNQIATKENMNFDNFMSAEAVQKKVEAIVGGSKRDQFITSIVASVQINPALKECTNTSIFSAALVGAALNLSPSPQLGQFYMVPFNNRKKGVKEAQFQIGYKGYQQLAIRSGQIRKLVVIELKKGELISYDPLVEEIEYTLINDEFEREATPTAGYYAYFKLIDGYEKSMYWSKDKMMIHADKYSQAFNLKSYRDLLAGKISSSELWKYSSFWYKDFDEMAKKTMFRQLISKGGCPMSIELQTALEKDMGVIRDDGKVEFVDDPNVVGEAETKDTSDKSNETNKEEIEQFDTKVETVKEQKSPLKKTTKVKEVDNNYLD